MATHQITLNSTSSLTGIYWQRDTSITDIAAIVNGILSDTQPNGIMPTAFMKGGALQVPNRLESYIKFKPGDWLVIDQQGWPLCISRNSLPITPQLLGGGTSFVFVTSSSGTMPTAAGWSVGQIVSTGSTLVVPGTKITKISSFSVTLSTSLLTSTTSSPLNAGTFTYT